MAGAAKLAGVLSAALLAALWLPRPSLAACTSPAGNAGDVLYSSMQNVMVYCNGANWINMGQVNAPVSYGTLTTGDFCTATGGSAITCTAGSTGMGSVVLSASPTLTGTITAAGASFSENVAIGTTVNNGALNVNGTVTATGFSGSGASLTGIGVSNLTAVTGTPSSTTFLAGDGTWETATIALDSGSQITGILPVPYGGTGLSSLAANSIYMGNGANSLVPSSLSDTGAAVTTPESVGVGVTSGASLGSLFNVNGAASIGAAYVGIAAPANGAAIQGNVAIGTTTASGALSVNGTTSSTLFSGSGASLTNIGTSNLSAITGTPSATTFLAGNGAWTSVSDAGGATGTGTANYLAMWSDTTTIGTSAIYQDGSGDIAIGTTTTSGALNVSGTTTSTLFSGSGASLTNIGTSNLTAVTGTPSASTFLAGNGAWSPVVASFSAGTTGLTPSSSTTGAVTLAGTLNVANGGTGLTALTSNTVYKGNGAGALMPSSIGDDGSSVTTSESVGIGTTSPQSMLHVAGGEVQVGSSGLLCTSAKQGAIRYANGSLFFCDNANSWELLDSSGGADSGDYMTATQTTNPAAGQGVYGGSAIYGALISGSGSISDVTLDNKNGNPALEVLTGTTNITMPGALAIGTTTTNGALNVNGNANVSGTLTAGTFSGSGASLTGIGTSNLTAITGTPSATTFLAGNGTWTSVSGAGGAMGTGAANYLAMWSNATTIGTSTIYQNGGGIAIGTTSTSGALNVNGTVTATQFSGSGASLTGIGTSNLSAVTGTPSASTFLAGNGAWTTLGGTLSGGVANYVPLWIGTASIGTSSIYQGATGLVSIGTTTSNGALNVNGTVTATLFSGSGASLTSIGTSNLTAITGTPSASTFLSGNGTWSPVVTSFGAGTTGLTPSSSTTGAVTLAGTLNVANGGTGLGTVAIGDILYGSSAGVLSRLAAGTNGYVLTLAGGVPTWAASTGGVTSFSAGTTGLTPSSSTTGAVTLAGVLGVANGGTGLSSLTSNVIYKGNGTSALVASGLTDSGTLISSSENVDVTGKAVLMEITNSTGIAGSLGKLNSSGAIVIGTSGDTDGMVGIVVGTSGSVAQVATSGQASCAFDGATVAGDYATISPTTGGDCHDAGAVRPGGTQSIGRVLSTNSAAGAYAVALGLTGVGGNVPNGTIAAFASTTCPTGWTTYTPAYGVFLRGIDPTGSTTHDPAGTRAAGSYQEGSLVMNNAGGSGDNRLFSLNSPSLAGLNYDKGNGTSSAYSGNWNVVNGAVASWTAGTYDPNYVGVTRPRNIAVLYCQYQGGGSALTSTVSASGATNYVARWTGATTIGTGTLYDNGSSVGVGTTTVANGALLEVDGNAQIDGTATATLFSGSGASLTGIGTSNLTGITGTPSATTFLAGNGAWTTIGGTLSGGVANYVPLWIGTASIGTSSIYQGATGLVSIGTTTSNGALNVNGTVTATLFSGSGASLTSIGTASLTGVSGSPSSTTYLRGDGNWASISGGTLASLTDVSLSGLANNNILQYNSTSSKWVNTALTSAVTAAIAPSFSVNNGTSTQTVTASTWTTMTLGTVAFDTTSGWSTSANAYTPTVAGKYIFTGSVICNSNPTLCVAAIAKNADCPSSNFAVDGPYVSGTQNNRQEATTIVDMNGTSDYVKLCGYTSTGTSMGNSVNGQYFSGALLAPLASGSVAGTGVASYLPVWKSGTTIGTSSVYQDGSGNIAIGTTSVTSGNILEVDGAAKVDTTVTAPTVNVTPQSTTYTVTAAGGTTVNTATTGQMAYYSASNVMSGTPDLYVSGSNIGIGTSSATNLLSLTGQNPQIFWMERDYTASTAGNSLTVQAGGAASGGSNLNGGKLILSSGISTGTGTSNIQFQTFPGTAGATADNTAQTRMTITGSGNVGIGTTSPNAPLQVDSGQDAAVIIQDTRTPPHWSYLQWENNAGTRDWTLGRDSSSPGNFNLYNGNTGITVILAQPGGNVGIGNNTSPSYVLDVTGQARFTGGYTTSDRRWKTNVAPIKGALETITELQGVNFDWRRNEFPDMHFAEGRQIGFVAQDVEKVLPEIVSTDNKGFKNVSYQSVTPVLVEAIKQLNDDLHAANDSQAKAVAALKAANDNLRAANDNLRAEHRADEARIKALEDQFAAFKTAKGKE